MNASVRLQRTLKFIYESVHVSRTHSTYVDTLAESHALVVRKLRNNFLPVTRTGWIYDSVRRTYLLVGSPSR